jgi:phosphoribosylformylglycinamidine (FGAM) synthase-like enzyme
MQIKIMKYAVKIDEAILKKHKINKEEYSKIISLIGREPNLVELGIFSAMWSEHCSYKTTRIHLKKMHTTGRQVICGPGENAGIVDAGDGDAIVFKMESHNHPSFIEPFNGAATGVGGILRDVFTMGARPIATLNSLRFGDYSLTKTQELLKGVVSGIGFYGNCVGVPTLGGECTFDASYNTNNLTNAMAIGLAKGDKIFYSAANKVGAKVLYFGSETGKDGIHGASMSSDSFDSNAKANKPTVQIGDPFVEKLLIEATLELMDAGCVLSIQDMGAAGLTCSCAEMAGKGDNGIEIDVSLAPLRDKTANAYEIMLSESQERMLMILHDKMEDKAREILHKWGLSYSIIGEITDTKRMIVKEKGEIVCNLPIHALSDEAPIYNRPYEIKTDNRTEISITKKETDVLEVLKTLMKSPDMIDKSFIWERYDTGVSNKSIIRPGQANAGVVGFGEEYEVALPAVETDKNLIKSQILMQKAEKSGCSIIDFIGSEAGVKERKYKTYKGLAVTTKCTPRYVLSNPFEGAKQAVASTYRNISAVGAKPLAITNCLNFASPEMPEIMGQIVASIEGITEASKKLDYPVVSGNVSLYNQTENRPINPTPAIGGVGVMKDFIKSCTYELKTDESFIFLVGETKGHIINTIYSNEIEKIKGGACPKVNLETEKANADFVRNMIEEGILSACASVLDGGILCTLTEMALAGKNDIGFTLNLAEKTGGISIIKYLFSEDSGRFICIVLKEFAETFTAKAMESNIITTHIGFTTPSLIDVNGMEMQLKEIYN